MNTRTRTIAGTKLHPVGLGCMNLSWAYGTPPSPEDGTRLLGRALARRLDRFLHQAVRLLSLAQDPVQFSHCTPLRYFLAMRICLASELVKIG